MKQKMSTTKTKTSWITGQKIFNCLVVILLMLNIIMIYGKEITQKMHQNQSQKDGKQDEKKLWRVSAFCPNSCCCGQFADGVTASGHVIKKGDKFCAADKSIPFGTLLDIPEYGKQVPVLDRGGAITGNRIDVFFDTHQEALNWGVKYLEVKR